MTSHEQLNNNMSQYDLYVFAFIKVIKEHFVKNAQTSIAIYLALYQSSEIHSMHETAFDFYHTIPV